MRRKKTIKFHNNTLECAYVCLSFYWPKNIVTLQQIPMFRISFTLFVILADFYMLHKIVVEKYVISNTILRWHCTEAWNMVSLKKPFAYFRFLVCASYFILTFINSSDIYVWWNWIERQAPERNNSEKNSNIENTKKERDRNADMAEKKHPQENLCFMKRNPIGRSEGGEEEYIVAIVVVPTIITLWCAACT